MNLTRVRAHRASATANVIVDPVIPPSSHPLVVWPAPRPATRRRIALACERSAAIEWIAQVPVLIEAAGARVEWIESGETIAAIERAIENSDAVVTTSAPAAVRAGRSRGRRFHSEARCVSAFGSSLAPHSLRHLDLLLVGAMRPDAHSWERSVRLACTWARDEERGRVHCAVRDPGWPILASDRAIRFRCIAREHREVESLRTTFHDTRRRLLFESRAYEALVADVGDLDALARAAGAGVGWCSATPALFVGDACTVLALDVASGARSRSAEAALAASLAIVRLLRHLGEVAASARLATALRVEVAERVESARDLWLDLASDTPGRFLDAVCARLAGVDPSVN
jgi:hypothetical protein